MELPDNAKPIRNSGNKFAAFISRNLSAPDCAYVIIFARKGKYDIDFADCRANYETLTKGATASARREIKKLECGQGN
jgi:hypothetical protein